MTRPFRLCLLVLLAAALAAPATASAASNQTMVFEAPTELMDDAARDRTLDEIRAFGVTHVRALIYWRFTTARPSSKRKPSFDMADHTAYPAGTWNGPDRLIGALRARGMTAQFTLTGEVPKWATKRKKDYVSDPGAKLFGKWATAVATRYGEFVDQWSIWNEPNHPQFLGPQYKNGRPHTPKLYRKLYVAGERAIHRTAGNEDDAVLFGETAPIGNVNVVSPLAFLRGAMCLNKNYKAKGKCKKLRIDGYAHHAYTRKQGPRFVSEDEDEVSIGSLGRLTKALDKAAKAKRIDRNRGIYLTEFGIQSWPDKLAGVRPSRQAEFIAMSEKIAYANPRVKAFSQYLMRDDGDPDGFQSGVRTAKGKKKPAYDGFALPLVATRYGSNDVLWGRVRPATGPTQVVIEHKTGKGKWKRLTAVQTSGVYGFRTKHRSKHRYRAKWTRPDGKTITGPPIRAY